MISDDHGSEELLLGMGALLASALLLLVVFSLFRTTLPADRSVALQLSASDVSGDIATVASSSVPFSHIEQYRYNGISISISSDYVCANASSGDCFAKPLPVRVTPGRYCSDNISWNDPTEFRVFLNMTYGDDGSEQSPIDSANASGLNGLLARSRLSMVATPLVIDPTLSLIIEKQFIYFQNNSSSAKECIPCVFVYQ